jgi:nucleolar protein 56
MTENSSGDVVHQRPVEHEDLSGQLYEPLGPTPGPGVLVLHGGGTRNERGYTARYARLLAHHGYAALDLEYFDTPETPPDLVEIPIEYFSRAIDWLAEQDVVRADRVGTVAWSRGTEAQLLLAARDERVGAVVAYVASIYAFPGLPGNEPGEGKSSAWSQDGEPVPYVPPYEGIEDDMDEPGGVRFRRTVDRAAADILEQARLPVEDVRGPVLFVSDGAAETSPSTRSAETAIDHLVEHEHPWPYEHRHYPNAGHAITSPYQPISEKLIEVFGGTRAGNTYAEADAWLHALECLRSGLDDS